MVGEGILDKKGTSPPLFLVRLYRGRLRIKRDPTLVDVRGGRFRSKRNLPSTLPKVGWGHFTGKRDLPSALFELGNRDLEAKENFLHICG